MSTRWLPTSPNFVNMISQGSRKSVPGAMRAKSVIVAGHVIRCQEIAKAAGAPRARPSAVDPEATMRLFQVCLRKSFRPNSSTKFSSVGVKMSFGGRAATSVRGLKASRKVQAIGNARIVSTRISCPASSVRERRWSPCDRPPEAGEDEHAAEDDGRERDHDRAGVTEVEELEAAPVGEDVEGRAGVARPALCRQ